MSGSLPSALKEQEAAADEAMASLLEVRSAGSDELEAESVVEDASTRDPFSEPSATPQPTPVAEPLAVETKKVEERIVNPEDFDKLSRRLDTMLGKYNSEVPRFQKQIRDLEAQNDSLKDELDDEKLRKVELDPAASTRYLSDEEREDLDEDLVDFQTRLSRGVAEEVASSKSKMLEHELNVLRSRMDDLNTTQEASQVDTFWADVERLAPGIMAANSSDDPGWVAFLNKIEPVSNTPYREVGETAVHRGDPTATANLFNLYKTSIGPKAEPRVTAEMQVKPETARSAPRTSAPKGKTIRQSEIEAFYRDAAGHLTETEINAKEAEFDRAASEGRIAFGK